MLGLLIYYRLVPPLYKIGWFYQSESFYQHIQNGRILHQRIKGGDKGGLITLSLFISP